MGFAGLKKPDERANVIAYLRTLSDSPAPLPPMPRRSASPRERPAPAEASCSGRRPCETPAGRAPPRRVKRLRPRPRRDRTGRSRRRHRPIAPKA